MKIEQETIEPQKIVLELEDPDYERLQEIYEILYAEGEENGGDGDYWSLSENFAVDSMEDLAAMLLSGVLEYYRPRLRKDISPKKLKSEDALCLSRFSSDYPIDL